MLMNVTEKFDSISIENKLELMDDEILLSPKPVSLNKSVSIVQLSNFDFYTNLHINRYAGDMEAFTQNTTMMLTNTLIANSQNFTTIFLSSFWLNRNKYQTLDLVFKDQTIQLKDFIGLSKKEKM
uniref:Uncharacterized protein n=1 Tax=Romanomermis culicivorax TaxID=13658 RepID=A0A915KBK9_ROMCU